MVPLRVFKFSELPTRMTDANTHDSGPACGPERPNFRWLADSDD